MMKEPTISVVMPVYNGEKYLAEAIESVLKQTFTDFEFLVINDGSTDATEKIILEHGRKDSRLKYIKNEKNQGLSEALNKGISIATGEYIARMDGDDICLPKRLEKQLKALEKNPDIGICGASYRFFGAKDNLMIQPEHHEDIVAGLLFGCTVTLAMFRKKLFTDHKLKYLTDYFPAEDYKMWADCARITRIYNVQEALFLYRWHGSQISTEKQQWQKQQSDRIRMEMLNWLNPDFSDKEKQYHLEEYVPGKPKDRKAFIAYLEWKQKLIAANQKVGNFSEEALISRLTMHDDHILSKWVHQHFFDNKNYNPINLFKYWRSGVVSRLSPKQNLKIVLKSLSFK